MLYLCAIASNFKHITDEIRTNDIGIPLEWLETMIGRRGTNIVRYVIVEIICFTFLYVVIACIRSICDTITTKVTTRTTIQRVPTARLSEESFYNALDELCKIDVL